MDLHLYSFIRLHGIVLRYTRGQFVLFAVICYCRFWIVIVTLMPRSYPKKHFCLFCIRVVKVCRHVF